MNMTLFKRTATADATSKTSTNLSVSSDGPRTLENQEKNLQSKDKKQGKNLQSKDKNCEVTDFDCA